MPETLGYQPPEGQRTEPQQREPKERPRAPESRAPVSDTVDEAARFDVLRDALQTEIARNHAREAAQAGEPSVDEVEQKRLEDLKRELEELRLDVDRSPTWKKWAAAVFDNAELSGKQRRVDALLSEIRMQEDLVRDLSRVFPVDGIIRSIKDKNPLDNVQLQSAFQSVRTVLQSPDLFGRMDIPTTNVERREARARLERTASSGDKVRTKWANAGLRLLTAYEKAYPTMEDRRAAEAAAEAARRAEQTRGGPVELVDGEWVPYRGELPEDATEEKAAK